MTAIAGYLNFGDGARAAAACRVMAAAQARFGPHALDVRALGDAAVGRNLFRLVPEDSFDRQPLIGGGGRFLFVADARVDNRSDLASSLGIKRLDLPRLADSDLLLAAWEKWSEAAVERVRGEYAFAVWDARDRKLTLIRGPLATRPLFYHEGKDFIAFASTPNALLALPEIPKTLDLHQAAKFLVRTPLGPSCSYFDGLKRLDHGCVAQSIGKGLQVAQFWQIRPRMPGRAKHCVEEFRELFDRAVAARVRRATGDVASFLSSGRDSSAVAATAALALARNNEPLLAFTAAPRLDFDGSTLPATLPDESALAARTAALHPNIQHEIVRPDSEPFGAVELSHRHNPNPIGHLSNFQWVRQIHERARTGGASVLLNGETGNFTISAGGVNHILDVLRERGLAEWWNVARRMHREGLASWQSLANKTFGPFLPRQLHKRILWSTGRKTDVSHAARLLRQPYRASAEQSLRTGLAAAGPPRRHFDYRRHMLVRRENSNKYGLACWGIDNRDPTIDQDLVDFCFSVPVELLVSPTSARPLFEAAMSDRLPPEVLHSRLRGYQGADWYRSFTQEVVREEFERCCRHELVRELLDVAYVKQLIDRWPAFGWNERTVMMMYRNDVLGAVSLANFIKANF